MPKIEIEFPDYSKKNGLRYGWEDGFIISTALEHNAFMINANKAGLISLAKQMLVLAFGPDNGAHYHYDDLNSLEDDSIELIICKMREDHLKKN
jgi:hypothetical protein